MHFIPFHSSFKPVDTGVKYSNLAVMEVELPSGFVVDMDTLPSVEGSNERITVSEKERHWNDNTIKVNLQLTLFYIHPQKVETENRGTRVIIYFDYIGEKEICPTLQAHKVYKVAEHKAASVIIYDYYDSSRRDRRFYDARKSTLCDICEGAMNCGNSCERAELRQSRRFDDGFHSAFDDNDNDKSNLSAASPLTGSRCTMTALQLLLFVGCWRMRMMWCYAMLRDVMMMMLFVGPFLVFTHYITSIFPHYHHSSYINRVS